MYSLVCSRHDQLLPSPLALLDHPSPSIWPMRRSGSYVYIYIILDVQFGQTKKTTTVPFNLNDIWSMSKVKNSRVIVAQ